MKRFLTSCVIVLIAVGLPAVALGKGKGNQSTKAGKHKGEQKQLDVDISFSGSSGTTVTDSEDITFSFWGYSYSQDKVYPKEYWGSYPLYFFGDKVGVTVKVTNNGPRRRAKLRIKTEAYVLKTDGSNGAALTEPSSREITVRRGETRTIDASFTADAPDATTSGLDRFIVKVLHPNEGGGPGNEEPALIFSKEGIFCPPNLKEKAEDEQDDEDVTGSISLD